MCRLTIVERLKKEQKENIDYGIQVNLRMDLVEAVNKLAKKYNLDVEGANNVIEGGHFISFHIRFDMSRKCTY